MKKILTLLLVAGIILSFATPAFAKAVDITASESFMLWNRCNNRECDESFILFGYSACTESRDMYPVVEKYAERKGVTMYAVEGSMLGIREALGGDSLELPAVVVYNGYTKVLGGSDGVTNRAMLEEVADEILDARNPEIKITIGSDIMLLDGKKINLDVPASIINGRTMIPLRAVFEAIGAEVEWYEETKSIRATKGETTVYLEVGSDKITVDYYSEYLDVPPVIVDGRTLVPVRAVTEAFGRIVKWDEKTKTVTIQ